MTQQHLFMDVQSASLEGATIIEHGPHGPIVGYVEFNGRHGIHQVSILWRQHPKGIKRVVIFDSASWMIQIEANVVFFCRTAPDKGTDRIPPSNVRHYSIVKRV